MLVYVHIVTNGSEKLHYEDANTLHTHVRVFAGMLYAYMYIQTYIHTYMCYSRLTMRVVCELSRKKSTCAHVYVYIMTIDI